MLARTIKSAAELGVTETQHKYLLQVLDMLERGELRHAPVVGDVEGQCFNMATYEDRGDCGTVGCIAGWMQVLSGYTCFKSFSFCPQEDAEYLRKYAPAHRFQRAEIVSRALHNLFHMGDCEHDDLETVTPDQAAQAIRNYLSLGEPCWSEVLA